MPVGSLCIYSFMNLLVLHYWEDIEGFTSFLLLLTLVVINCTSSMFAPNTRTICNPHLWKGIKWIVWVIMVNILLNRRLWRCYAVSSPSRWNWYVNSMLFNQLKTHKYSCIQMKQISQDINSVVLFFKATL